MTERKYMSVQEFVDSGMLFEVNRRVLHPLGVAIEVVKEEDGSMAFGGVWDRREDPEGILFEEATFWRGMRKWARYLAEAGLQMMTGRQETLGFVRQTETPFKKGDVLVLWDKTMPTLPRRMRVLEFELGATEYKIRDLEGKPIKVKTRVKGRVRVKIELPDGVLATSVVHRNYYLEEGDE